MAPQTGTTVLVIAVFVLPGFVTLLLRERTYVVRSDESAFERLLGALYYSSLVFGWLALMGLLAGVTVNDVTRLWHGRASLASYVGLGIAGLVLLPAVLAEVGRLWKRSRRLRPAFLARAGIEPGHTTPAGWEQLFSTGPGALADRGLLLRVTLIDGRIVGGFFGKRSLAGYTAHTCDLFIEERWSFDEEDAWFEAPVEANCGLWISDREIRSIEAYAPHLFAT